MSKDTKNKHLTIAHCTSKELPAVLLYETIAAWEKEAEADQKKATAFTVKRVSEAQSFAYRRVLDLLEQNGMEPKPQKDDRELIDEEISP